MDSVYQLDSEQDTGISGILLVALLRLLRVPEGLNVRRVLRLTSNRIV